MRMPTGIPAVAAVIGFHGPVLAQQAPGPDDLASAFAPREDLFRLGSAVGQFSAAAAVAPAGKSRRPRSLRT